MKGAMISTYGIVYENKSILYVHRRSTKSRPHAGYKPLLTIACALINSLLFIMYMKISAYKIPKSVLKNETLAKLSPHTPRCFKRG